MSNVLKIEKQEAVIRCLLEGSSVRSTERMTDVHRDTILRLMCRVGFGCEKFMDLVLVNLDCQRIQVDEIWGFVKKKQRIVQLEEKPNEVGDMWTFVGLDADTKLVPTYLVGKRTAENARAFMDDLAFRLRNRIQLSTDKLPEYVNAVERAFGADVDYSQIVKYYETEFIEEARKYSPPKVVGIRRKTIMGDPDPVHISTSYVERQNLTMRMCMRRFTRLTNAFSKKLENLKAAVALHFFHYNFCRVHTTLRVTPAMEAGVENRVWTVADLLRISN